MDLDLQGKSVVVTGGGSNIGRAIVLAFAREGASVTLGDIDMQQARRTAELALREGAAGAEVVEVDVARPERVAALFEAAVGRFGGVDVLVNNAGWWGAMSPFAETAPETWQQLIAVNYVGGLNCTRAALALMLPRKAGAILFVSSDASRQGEAGQAVYSGVKAAINAFAKSIARENGPHGIRCNVVSPGPTIPDAAEDVGGRSLWAGADATFSAEQRDKLARSLPLRKLGRAQDIAQAVVFLASARAAGHITGQVLSVSGGYSMVG